MTTGVPVRGGAIQYHRVEAGWLVADIYGVAPRAIRVQLVRSMDDPHSWLLEPCYSYGGVEQEAERASLFLDGFVGSRDPSPSLRAAKALLRDIWREWIERTEATDA